MLSKLVRQAILTTRTPQKILMRRSGLIPPSQYDIPLTPKLQLGYAIKVYWEIIPLVITTVISIGCGVGSIFWAIAHKSQIVYIIVPSIILTAFYNITTSALFTYRKKRKDAKVDVVFTTHSRACISRTMDLRNPSIHRLIIINQRYEPWPELQIVLDKMTAAEKRALVRMQSCSHP